MHDELAGRDDVLILAINSGEDSRAEVGEFWAEAGYSFPAVVDLPGARGQLTQALGAMAFPTNIVVGPDGVVLRASHGFQEKPIRKLLGL